MPSDGLSVTTERSPWLMLLVGVLLVANPLYVPVADLSSPDHVYGRASISANGDSLDYEAGLRVPIEGIDCFEEPRRDCTIERALVGENLTVDSRPVDGRSPDPFVALPSGWYERIVTESGGNVTYRLRPVSLSNVLRSVSVAPKEIPARLRPAAEGGRVTLESPIEETYVVRADGEYYYLTEAATKRPPFGEFYGLLSAVGVLAGAILLVLAGRRREAHDRRKG